jgi:nicotinamidase-related amidase
LQGSVSGSSFGGRGSRDGGVGGSPYGAFDGTGLDERLRKLGVDEVVLTGQHTHICVRHTSHGALIRGNEITVPRDAVCAFEGVDEEEALDYLRVVYGAHITTVDSPQIDRVDVMPPFWMQPAVTARR